jgi:hypothetical protein
MDKQHILHEIQRTAKANAGKPLGEARFAKQTGIRRYDWYGSHWNNWGEALQDAGYNPNTFQKAWTEQSLINSLISLTRELGHYPIAPELIRKHHTEPNFPSRSAFQNWAPKGEAITRVLAFCRAHDGYEDVIAICESALPAVAEGPNTKSAKAELGFVYMLKFSKYYKIGRSNAQGRREYELGIQLPEKPRTVHVIRTDDAVGIEAYWHNRFAHKRKGGEWFDLDSRDVAAFRRRKFM